jgi:hypothetical protein
MKTLILNNSINFTVSKARILGPRVALAYQEEIDLAPGTWLAEISRENGTTTYMLADGRCFATDKLLSTREADDPQIAASMAQQMSLKFREKGLEWVQVSHHDPFAIIFCPICRGTEFTSIEGTVAVCSTCNTSFLVRYTAGDPGFVVDATCEHTWLDKAIYMLPPTPQIYLSMVFKDSGDPREMDYDDEKEWHHEDCSPDSIHLTTFADGVRQGLHACKLGTVYQWKIWGYVPSLRALSPHIAHSSTWRRWQIDGEMWPACAVSSGLALAPSERYAVERAICHFKQADQVPPEQLVKMLESEAVFPLVHSLRLPAPEILKDGEQYLLHHWLLKKDPGRVSTALPVWYVVKRKPKQERYDPTGWEVISREAICPSCGQPGARDDHSYCRETLNQIGWPEKLRN